MSDENHATLNDILKYLTWESKQKSKFRCKNEMKLAINERQVKKK